MTCWQELCAAIILEATYQAVDFWDGDRTFFCALLVHPDGRWCPEMTVAQKVLSQMTHHHAL